MKVDAERDVAFFVVAHPRRSADVLSVKFLDAIELQLHALLIEMANSHKYNHDLISLSFDDTPESFEYGEDYVFISRRVRRR